MSPGPEWVSAIAGSITAVAAIAAVAVAYWQLGAIARQTRTEGNRERQWRTIAACQQYTIDPVLSEAKKKIFAAARAPDKKIIDPKLVKPEALFILNYLDSIAIGVRQDAFIKQIVIDNLSGIMNQAVTRYIEGQEGDFGIHNDQLKDLIQLVQEFRSTLPGYRPKDT